MLENILHFSSCPFFNREKYSFLHTTSKMGGCVSINLSQIKHHGSWCLFCVDSHFSLYKLKRFLWWLFFNLLQWAKGTEVNLILPHLELGVELQVIMAYWVHITSHTYFLHVEVDSTSITADLSFRNFIYRHSVHTWKFEIIWLFLVLQYSVLPGKTNSERHLSGVEEIMAFPLPAFKTACFSLKSTL